MYSTEWESDSGKTEWVIPIITTSSHEEPVSTNWLRNSDLLTFPAKAGDVWRNTPVPTSLYQRVAREAHQSDVITGTTPEDWSPFGRVDHAGLGRWKATLEFDSAVLGRTVPAEVVGTTSSGWPLLRFYLDDEPYAIASFSSLAFAVAVPEEAAAVVVHVNTYDEADGDVRPAMDGALEPARDDDIYEDICFWRVYAGRNSYVLDSFAAVNDGVCRLVLQGWGSAMVVVGRILRVKKRAAPILRDFTADFRRQGYQREYLKIAEACPVIGADPTRVARPVVAVHGTMSCAIPLAAELHDLSAGRARILRFEHDTWSTINSNAEELAELINRHVDEAALLVAHSRGGLVAARAATKVARLGGPRLEIIALGTPFLGTPLVRAGNRLCTALAAIGGAIRAATMMDPLTRLFVPLFPEVPPGIAVMDPDNEELALLREVLPTDLTTAAGSTIRPDAEYYGLGGFARGTFANILNDLVVGQDSALGGVEGGLRVECDHFSYLKTEGVQELLRGRLDRFTSGISRVAS